MQISLLSTIKKTLVLLSLCTTSIIAQTSNTHNKDNVTETLLQNKTSCGNESFENSNATNSYTTNHFTGNNGITWHYVHSRNANNDANNSGINLPAIMLRRKSSNSKVYASGINGGIGNFSAKLYKGFTGAGNRQVELFINGVSKGKSTPFDDNSEHIFNVDNININGNITIEIRNNTGKQIIVDDISWTCYTPVPEIEIQGNNTNIANNNTTPNTTNHTDFGSTTIGNTITRTFTIKNIGDADLTLSNPTISGSNASDFVITTNPNSTVTANGSTTFQVTFTPSVNGDRTATININNNDSSKNPFTFAIKGNGLCSPTHTVTNITPNNGPAKTTVKVIGTGFTNSSTATFNGANANVVFVSTTELLVTIPENASSNGTININESGCEATTPNFTITKTTNCNSTTLTGSYNDIFISEIFDSDRASVFYIELYNPTNATVTLDGTYEIEAYNLDNVGNASLKFTVTSFNGTTIAPNTTVVFNVNDDTSNTATFCNNVGAIDLNNSTGFGINENDRVILTKNTAPIDIVETPNETGYSITRNLDADAPSDEYDDQEWGLSLTETCDGLGNFGSTENPLAITAQPNDLTICIDSGTFSVIATPSNQNNTLSYQWYYNDQNSNVWTLINTSTLGNSTVTGATTKDLKLTGGLKSLANYQFYCLVTEVGGCDVPTKVAKINDTLPEVTWNGTNWVNGTNFNKHLKKVIIDGNYDMTTKPSIDACECEVKADATLTIAKNKYLAIRYDLINTGTITIEDSGSVTQTDNNATVIGNGSYTVKRKTTELSSNYTYSYWSSPITDATLGQITNDARFYYFYDNSEGKWVESSATTTMINGLGYITNGPKDATYPLAFHEAVFTGSPFNTGNISAPVRFSDDNDTANDYGLAGNPYPSAIDAEKLIANNPAMGGTIYYWTHNTNTQYGQQHTENDFVQWNGTGSVANCNGCVLPTQYIASGQSFAYNSKSTGNIKFSNEIRVKTDNDKFYRHSTKDRIWLNLKAPSFFSQILVGFIPNATNGFDWLYDGRTIEGGNGILYSIVKENNTDNFLTIQGRQPLSNNEEVIPLGVYMKNAGEATISIANLEGRLNDVTVFLEDKELDIIHDLKDSNYKVNLTTTGNFHDRFYLLINSDRALNIEDISTQHNTLIISDNNNTLTIKDSKGSIIKNIVIYDLLGKELMNVNEKKSIVEINSNKLKSNTVLLIKTTLENGTIFTDKLIKK